MNKKNTKKSHTKTKILNRNTRKLKRNAQYYKNVKPAVDWDDIKLKTVFRPEMFLLEAREKSLEGAWKLGLLLKQNGLDLVTAESLTAGMIGKTIIDIPYFGAAVLYGGFIVYNTDAKRLYLNVNTPSVYSQETARQMSEGALTNSRAMVALAVTGNAMPYPEHSDAAGIVDVGLSIRTSNGILTETYRFKLCEEVDMLKQICSLWKAEGIESNVRNIEADQDIKLSENLSNASYKDLREEMGKYEKAPFWKSNYARFQTTSRMAEGIRLFTVAKSCEWATKKLNEFISKNKDIIKTATIKAMPWDKEYLKCGEPSMRQRLPGGAEEYPISWPAGGVLWYT